MDEKTINSTAEEISSEEKTSVWQKVKKFGIDHKKGLIRGAIAGVAGAAGLAFAGWAIKHAGDDYDYEFDDEDDFEELLKQTDEDESGDESRDDGSDEKTE